MRTLRELLNSYATPPTEEEMKLLRQLDDGQRAKPRVDPPPR